MSPQLSVDNPASWATNWQLSINISKCVVFRIGSKRGSASLCYIINNMTLINIDLVTDLGAAADSDLSFMRILSAY
jgi:hypothetical protein